MTQTTDSYDADVLEKLTPQERAALEEVDEQEPEQASETEDEAAETRHEPAPIYAARAPENADAFLARFDEIEGELAARYDEGEITGRELRDGLKQVAEKREELNWSKRKAELADEMTRQAQESAWNREVRDFMRTTGANIAKSEAAMLAFDEHVKTVTADPANQRLSDRGQLDKAYKLFIEDMGAAFGAGAARQSAGHDGAEHGADGGDYAALDRLAATDPIAYEQALARMSRDEMDRYGF